MNVDINKIKQAEKEGKLIPFEKIFNALPKSEREDIKQRAKLIMVRMEMRKLRKQKNLTQEGLAKKMNVKREYISRIESGEQNVTLETLIKIASAVGKEFKFKFE